MDQSEPVLFFFRQRWPNGFACPRCGHCEYYTISTRQLPLYECKLCRHQTSVTAGTLMHKTRIPLAKWAAAVEWLSTANGVNAKRLSSLIGVAHSTAWLMLRKFRQAIGEAEAERKLAGTVHIGLRILAPKYIFIFLPHRRYRCERVVSVSAEIGPNGLPTALKLSHVDDGKLTPGFKELTKSGKAEIAARHAHPDADTTWLNSDRMHRSSLRQCFLEARHWLVRLFNGVGSKYLQSYLDEFCFRWNAASNGMPLKKDLYKFCISRRTHRASISTHQTVLAA